MTLVTFGVQLRSLVRVGLLTGLSAAACAPPAAVTTMRATRVSAPAAYTPTAPLRGPIVVAFALPRGDAETSFWSLPWPSDLKRRADGRPDFRGFPGADTGVFGPYVATAARDVDGYSVSPNIYFHFTGALAELPLPTEPAALASASSPVFLVDVDPTSPERGRFHPLAHRYYASDLRYVPGQTLAVKPSAGDILRPGNLYAAVVRRALVPGGLGTTMDLEAIKWTEARTDPREEAARQLHRAAFDQLAASGVPRSDIAAIALFRTQVPTAMASKLFDAVTHLPPARAPRIVSARWATNLAGSGAVAPYTTIEGVYCTPSFQSEIEHAPFIAQEGGRIRTDATGAPELAPVPEDGPYGSHECRGLLRARFVLTVPDGSMPPDGYPLLVTAHGTGGDARSFLGARNFAGWAARQGIAAVSTDQPLHGGRGSAARPGSREPIEISIGGFPLTLASGPHAAEEAFYNPVRPAAARDNLRQAAVDAIVLTHLIAATDFAVARGDDDRPLVTNAGRQPPRFDPRRVVLAGHSQGAHSIAMAAALDPMVRGVLLSGCGGDARIGILKRTDIPIVPIFRTLLGLLPGELDEHHPLMALVQTLADPIDPASFARSLWEPPAGRRAPDVLHYGGSGDSFSPPASAELLALALHAERSHALTPARRTFAQFTPTYGEDGHFVLYEEPDARDLAMEFLRAASR